MSGGPGDGPYIKIFKIPGGGGVRMWAFDVGYVTTEEDVYIIVNNYTLQTTLRTAVSLMVIVRSHKLFQWLYFIPVQHWVCNC